MINITKLIKMARKWQRAAALQRRRISLPKSSRDAAKNTTEAAQKTNKGHFIVYTEDQRRYSFPISYLHNTIFQELFKMAEEEFGLPNDGPITFPFDAVFMDYIVSLVKCRVDIDTEKALLISMVNSKYSTPCSLYQRQTNQQLLVCSF